MGVFFNTSTATPPTLITADEPVDDSDGVLLENWGTEDGRTDTEAVILLIDSDDATTIAAPVLWGMSGGGSVATKWRNFGELDDIAVAAGKGRAIPLGAISICTRLALVGTPSGGAEPTYQFVPQETE